MIFVHDHANPRAVMDDRGTIWVLRSTRDVPHGKASYLIRWKNGRSHSVLADEILSEEARTFTVAMNRCELNERVLEKEYSADVDQFENLLRQAIVAIKKAQYGDFFERREIKHIVRFVDSGEVAAG